MAEIRLKAGAVEMTATGDPDFIAQERGAFVGYLKDTIDKEILSARLGQLEPQNKPEPPATGIKLTRHVGSRITYEELRTAVERGRVAEVIGEYDELEIPIDTGGTITVVCAYVDEEMARFVFKDCWDEHVMNAENTNKGGYHGSDGRIHVLEDIYPRLPQGLRDIITPRSIIEVIDGKKVEYADALWLPSATDMFGGMEGKWWPDEPDSFQLPIFRRERDRVKECGDNGTYPQWLRSVSATNTAAFCSGSTSGGADSDNAYYSDGFAPGFDI